MYGDATDLDHVLGEQRRRAGSPQQLAELLHGLLVEQLALEVPQPEAVVDLVAPPADGGGDVAAGRVPLDVGGHEVLRGRHDLQVVRVDEL